jgi:hypothetical protein
MKYVIISLIVCITIVAIAAIIGIMEKKIVCIIDSKKQAKCCLFF